MGIQIEIGLGGVSDMAYAVRPSRQEIDRPLKVLMLERQVVAAPSRRVPNERLSELQ